MAKSKSKGGRPPHAPTKTTRERVKLLKADGWSNERVAANLMICRNTLEEHYPLELQYGADEKRAENLESMWKAAKKGNAAAGKWVDERFTRAHAAAEVAKREVAEDPTPAPAPKLGKKEQAQEAANKVTGKFAPPAPPKLH